MDIGLLTYSLSIFVLILLSGFFSGSETGLTATSAAKIHKLKTEGNKRAKSVAKLIDQKEQVIGTILLGNNAVNILASALATSLAIKLFGEVGVVYATFTMTLAVLIFAEVLPKTYSITRAEKVALLVAPTFIFLVKLFSPFTNLVQNIVNLTLKIFSLNKISNGNMEGDELISGPDALRGAIDLHHHEGSVVKGEKDMLGSILDLGETEVGEIMVHRKQMITINADLPTSEILSELIEGNHTRVPIWRDKSDNIVGVVHIRDLLKEVSKHEDDIDKINIFDVCQKPWFVPEKTSLSVQLSEFRKRRSHFALVVDEYGDLLGLITLEDILEEIVGDIEDEHDKIVKGIKKLKGNFYHINGDVNIRDINRQLDWRLPDEEASTIAGLVINEAETIPVVGQEFNFFGFKFKILEMDKNQIISLKVKKV